MLDHIGLDVTDFDRSRAFYERALAPLGIAPLMEPVPGVAGFGEQHDQKPYFPDTDGTEPRRRAL
jgi:catechol 2,3-dioxygenase-like lactoylglutathione lyase family enzyme